MLQEHRLQILLQDHLRQPQGEAQQLINLQRVALLEILTEDHHRHRVAEAIHLVEAQVALVLLQDPLVVLLDPQVVALGLVRLAVVEEGDKNTLLKKN